MAPVSRTAKREQEPPPWVFPQFRRQKPLGRVLGFCAVARDSRFGDRLPLKQYLAASQHRCCHLCRGANNSKQATGGCRCKTQRLYSSALLRRGAAMPSRHGTGPTLTSGMTSVIKNNRRLRLVKALQELHAFYFLMAWHPRLNTDPRHFVASRGCAINSRSQRVTLRFAGSK